MYSNRHSSHDVWCLYATRAIAELHLAEPDFSECMSNSCCGVRSLFRKEAYLIPRTALASSSHGFGRGALIPPK